MALRDVFLEPPGPRPDDPPRRAAAPRGGIASWLRGAGARSDGTVALCLGVLATQRDLLPAAIGAGAAVAQRAAALVCAYGPGAALARPPFHAPARAAAVRLAASLSARGLAAEARGRVALVQIGSSEDGRGTGDEAVASLTSGGGVDTAHSLDPAGAVARAIAAANRMPTVLAVAVRDPELDAVLANQDAILVTLPPSVDPLLAELVARSASTLGPRTVSVTLGLDPLSRALALAGLRAPAALRAAIEAMVR